MTSKDSKQKKAYYKLLSINIIFITLTCLLLNIFSEDETYSVKEKRYMALKPMLTLTKIFDGTITKEIESYVSDQFILRNKLIDIKAHTDKLLGKNQFNGVYRCKDNYLITPFEQPEAHNLLAKQKTINDFFLQNSNLVNRLMIVPTKCAVLQDKLPYFAPNYDEKICISDFYKNIISADNVIDLMETFTDHRKELLFYKTDHHWTTLGAYYGYKDFCNSMGILNTKEDDYDILNVSNTFFGSLYSKVSFNSIKPDNIKIYVPKKNENIMVTYEDTEKKSSSLYNSTAIKGHDKYNVFTDGNHSLMKIRTEAKNNKNLLLIKDSYANSFVPFLTSHFNNILVVDLRYYTDNIQALINDYDITHTLILYNAETFFEDDSILNLSHN